MNHPVSKRQRFLIELIVNALGAYESGDVNLARLIVEVESGIDALFDIADDNWIAQLRSAWSGLEIVYAMALDEGRSTLSDEERGEIAATVSELRSLLAAGVST